MDWLGVNAAVITAVSQVLQEQGIPAAQEAARGAIFLAQAEQTMQENSAVMSENTKKLLAEQQKLAFQAYITGYEGVNILIAAKAFDAAVGAIAAAIGKAPFLAA